MIQNEKPAHVVELGRIDDLLRDEQLREGEAAARRYVAERPNDVDGLILLGRALIDLIQFEEALEVARRAIAIDPSYPMARLLLVNGLMRCGFSEESFAEARKLETDRQNDPVMLVMVGNLYAQCNRHGDALRCYERAHILQPANFRLLYNLSSTRTALGQLDEAEALLNKLLQRAPTEYHAYYNRSSLKKQAPEHNHVEELERILKGLTMAGSGEPLLCYSLARELEDIKEYKRAFAYLRRGAAARKRSEGYTVGADLSVIEGICKQFDAAFFERSHRGYGDEKPLFVLGMPRTGTTLVDRILSSHSQVGSVGETGEFTSTLSRRVPRDPERKLLAIPDIDEVDYEALGREYCRAIRGLLPGPPRLLEKTPNNFINLGMIVKALPNAKIVHLRRHPVDACYAIYKTLFREGYGFSYDLRDLGRFYLAYLKIMEHWRTLLPGRFLDVQYEELVENQEAMTRRMLEFCELDWEDACLSFERNASPSLTASAAQVRRPIYKTSVALWRHYEEELQPLIRTLREGGVEID